MSDQKVFEASPEARGKAKKVRLFAFLAWIVAIAGQLYAIFNLISNETLIWLIVAIVVILILAITGSTLWKKANRLSPASEKDKVRFFVQNQLGAIMGVLAFLPLVVLIFMDKNIDGKTKGIAGSIAVIAMVAAGVTGADFSPPSIEKYTEEINQQTDDLKKINLDNDNVYWTTSGSKFHIFEDCYYIKNRSISNGTVKESWKQKGISELCKTCRKRAMKERNISEQ